MNLQIVNEISLWLAEYLRGNNLDCFVVGVSGGIDSALVSTLCAHSGIPTYVLNMPIHSKKENTRLSSLHCQWLTSRFSNVMMMEADLTETYDCFKNKLAPSTGGHELSLANSKSRLRMMALYYIAGSNRGLVVGTGNKVEDFGVGFFTKYGDGGVDISPIADLTKTQVRKLSAILGISQEILSATPTDGLWEDSRSDEEQIGATYEELEWAMSHKNEPSVTELTERQKQVLIIYDSYNQKNKHKMLPIPVFKLKDNF